MANELASVQHPKVQRADNQSIKILMSSSSKAPNIYPHAAMRDHCLRFFVFAVYIHSMRSTIVDQLLSQSDAHAHRFDFYGG